jgi:hypothetical protein
MQQKEMQGGSFRTIFLETTSDTNHQKLPATSNQSSKKGNLVPEEDDFDKICRRKGFYIFTMEI